MTLTAVSLFAGVGGFDLALQRAGVDVVAAVEIDKAARSILAQHFPDTTLFPNVTEVTCDDLTAAGFVPERGILTGGFPCQDLSVAGRRAGLAGERSGLFWEIVRLVDGLRPRWLILENVPGLLSSNDGRDMGIVLGALGDLGYGFAYRVLDAQHFGVPQRRRRVFIVAGRRAGGPDITGPAQVLLEPESMRGDSAPRQSAGQDTAGTLGGGSGGRGWACDTDRMTFVPVGIVDDETAAVGIMPTIGINSSGGGGHPPAVLTPPPAEIGVQQRHAERGQHGDDGHGDAPRPRYRVAGGDVVNTIPASLYHHGTVVNQDADAGHLVIQEAECGS